MKRLFFIIILLVWILSGCASNGGDDGAAAAVESFWNAKVAGDSEALRGVMCATMESDIEMQAMSFASVEAELDGMTCATSSENGDFTVVTCEGQIVALYGTETRAFPLGASQVIQEDGEWKWCGEATG